MQYGDWSCRYPASEGTLIGWLRMRTSPRGKAGMGCSRKAPALRAAGFDGFCPAKVPDEHGDGSIKPADIRAIKAFIEAHRSSRDPPERTGAGADTDTVNLRKSENFWETTQRKIAESVPLYERYCFASVIISHCAVT